MSCHLDFVTTVYMSTIESLVTKYLEDNAVASDSVSDEDDNNGDNKRNRFKARKIVKQLSTLCSPRPWSDQGLVRVPEEIVLCCRS